MVGGGEGNGREGRIVAASHRDFDQEALDPPA